MTPRRPRSPARKRGGWQLFELSMVLAVLGMISIAATRTIVALMGIENRSGQSLQDSQILQRMGQQWRADLHRATAVRLAENDQTLEIQLPEAQVTWRIADSRLSRQQSAAGRKATSRESYPAAARQWRFEIDGVRDVAAVIRESAPLMLTGSTPDVSPSRVDRIESAMGSLSPLGMSGRKESP